MKLFFTLLLQAVVSAIFAQNVTIYSYTTATDGSYNSIDNNITATGLGVVNGALLASPTTICPTGLTTRSYSSALNYNSNLDAVEFSITPIPGKIVKINNFSIDLRRSGVGPTSVRLAYQIGSGSIIDKGSDDSPFNGSCGQTSTVSWSGMGISTNNKVTIRIYGFNSSDGRGYLQLLNAKVEGTIEIDIAAPVELTEFKTQKTGKTITLNWETATETDNSHFDIEHSTDGKSFKSIGKVKGKGTSQVSSSYTYEHTTPSVGENYYRLKQVDFSGKYSRSKVISVIHKTKNLLINTLTNDVLLLNKEDIDDYSTYEIVNIMGAVVRRGSIVSESSINVSDLVNGAYFMRVGTQIARFNKF